MQNVKPINTPLTAHFKLSSALSLQSKDEINYMSRVPYCTIVSYFMYAMVCLCPDLSYVVSAFSRYIAKLGKNIRKQTNRF